MGFLDGSGGVAPMTPLDEHAHSRKPPPPRPRLLDIAVWCWVGALVISVASGVIELLLLPSSMMAELRSEMTAMGNSVDTSTMKEVYATIKPIGIVTELIVGGIWLLFVVKLRSGRNWARILLAALGVAWLVVTLSGVSDVALTQQLVAFAQTIATVSALYFMFTKPVNAYFAELRRRRQ
ncbi:MAG: hypothetical protein ACRDRL_14630 [Sciscionella sp.]